MEEAWNCYCSNQIWHILYGKVHEPGNMFSVCAIDSTILISLYGLYWHFEDQFGLCSERSNELGRLCYCCKGGGEWFSGINLEWSSNICNLVYVTSASTTKLDMNWETSSYCSKILLQYFLSPQRVTHCEFLSTFLFSPLFRLFLASWTT